MMRERFSPLRIALFYAVFGAAWILLSDSALHVLVQDAKLENSFQTVKGWFFIIVSGGLFYWLASQMVKELKEEIVERKQANAALRESQARLIHIMDNSPAPIYFKDTEGRFLVANRRYQEMYDVKFEDIKGKNSKEIFGNELGRKFFEHDQEVLNSRKAIEREENITGQTYLTLKFPIVDSNGVLLGLGGVETDISEIKLAEENVRRLAYAIEGLSESFALYGPDEKLVICNENYRRVNMAVSEATRLGVSYEEHLRAVVDEGLVPKAIGREEEYIRERLERYRNPTGPHEVIRQDRVWLVHEQRVTDGSMAVIATDITERKQTEKALRDQTISIQLLQKIAVAANEADNVLDALQVCVDEICAYTGWPVGHAYTLIDKGTAKLTPTKVWHLDHPEEFETFRRVTEETSFSLGEGLPGRVWATGESACIVDVNKDPNFPQAKLANDIGVKAGFAFPVLAGPKVVAVVEFFSSKAVVPSRDVLDVMVLVGAQLGRVIERKIVEKALSESENRFRDIADVASDWMWETDSEYRFTYLPERVFKILGVEPDELLGMTRFDLPGVDADPDSFEKHRADIEARRPFKDFIFGFVRPDGKTVRVSANGKPVFDDSGTFMGYRGTTTNITQRWEVEQSLRESESLFRATIDHLPLGLNVKDLDGRFLLVNKATADRYGLLKEDFIGKTSAELFPEAKESSKASRAQEIELIKTRKGTRRIQEKEFQDETLHTLLIDKFPIFDDEGNLVSIGITAVDITEQKQAEQALKESESLFRTTTDHLPIWLNVKDINGRYLLANKTMADKLGLPQEDFIGKTNKELFPEAKESNRASRAQEIELIKTRKGTRRVQEKKFQDKTLHTLLIDKFPIFDDEGNHVSIGITGMDITEQKQAEQALKESEERLRSLVDHLADAIFLHDSRGRFRLVNREACRSLGFEEEELLGMSVSDIEVGITTKEVRVLSKLVNSNETLTIEGRHRRKDGTEFDVEVVLSPYVMDGKKLIMVAARDITDRKEVQAQLIQSAKLATLGEMSAGMAHELSQPLNIIRFAAEGSLLRMARGAFTAEDQKAQFETIDSQCQRMANIVDHMRVFSRKDNTPLEIFNPMETVNEAIKLISSQFAADGIEISSRLPSRTGRVQGRKIQLEQVILNLLSNARDSILEKQKSLGEDDAWCGKIDIVARRDNASKTVIISIGDDGMGIPKDIFERIFEPFFTSKTGGDGTGLGLSVSYGIIEGMSGRLSAENTKTGARFEIMLPLVKGKRKALSSMESRVRKEKSSKPCEPCHILVVDDEKEATDALARFLEDQGHSVSMASDGVEAYDMFVRDSADMVVTDIRMPGMDGEQLIKRLRERAPDLPIIVVTGHLGLTEILDNSTKNEITHVFKKPVSLTELGDAIQNIIRDH